MCVITEQYELGMFKGAFKNKKRLNLELWPQPSHHNLEYYFKNSLFSSHLLHVSGLFQKSELGLGHIDDLSDPAPSMFGECSFNF